MPKTTQPKVGRSVVAQKALALPAGYVDVRSGIVELLNVARLTAARNVNAMMTASYWEIGRRIVEAEQKGKRRAGYGEQLIERLSADLTQQFGRGFSPDNLENMRRFFMAAARNRMLTADALMGLTVPAPALSVQNQFVELKNTLKNRL